MKAPALRVAARARNARQNGYEAALAGHAREENPHMEAEFVGGGDCPLRKAWDEGWLLGESERRKGGPAGA